MCVRVCECVLSVSCHGAMCVVLCGGKEVCVHACVCVCVRMRGDSDVLLGFSSLASDLLKPPETKYIFSSLCHSPLSLL